MIALCFSLVLGRRAKYMAMVVIPSASLSIICIGLSLHAEMDNGIVLIFHLTRE
jgi:hypothetical protein